MKYTICLLIVIFSQLVLGQKDSIHEFSFEEFVELVKTNHPIARQAELTALKGEAALLSSKGGFDPKLVSDFSQKQFDSKDYYTLFNAGLKIPTWFGIELKSELERNRGTYINPENSVPGAGLWNAGISVTLGKGLLIDERRANFRQAQIYQTSSKVEQNLMLNELYYQAGKTYLDWFMAYHTLGIYQDALAVSELRLEGVKLSAFAGDRPFIDTVEAGIQVQNRLLFLQEAQLDFANTGVMLSTYLWLDGYIPLELDSATYPISLENLKAKRVEEMYVKNLDTLVQNHPELSFYGYKVDQLGINRRMKVEQLKPTLNVRYNAINEPLNGDPFANYSPNNYKWGMEFSVPIFLRKERGELNLANLKIQDAQLDITIKQAALLFKSKAALNEWRITKDQHELYSKTVIDYGLLLEGERRMFNGGESSLFLVNSRELGFIQAKVKNIELLTKNRKAHLNTLYCLGILWQEW
jgi:outer membrane protein TolC